MMPDKSGPHAESRLQRLSLLLMKSLSSNELGRSLRRRKIRRTPLDDWQTRNLQLMRRRWLHTTAVPADLLDAFTRTCMQTESVWRTARPDNYFGAILPHLKPYSVWFAKRQPQNPKCLVCHHTKPFLICTNPAVVPLSWMRYSTIMPLSSSVFERVLERQSFLFQPRLPNGPFRRYAKKIYADGWPRPSGSISQPGRFDATLHPFSGGIPEDSRITTRRDEADFTSALMGVSHETGHAMYERLSDRLALSARR